MGATCYPTKREGRFLKVSTARDGMVRVDLIDFEKGQSPDTADHTTVQATLTLDAAEAMARDMLDDARKTRINESQRVSITPSPYFDVRTS